MFRFSIRDLLLTTVAAAIGVAWYCDHQRLTSENRQLKLKSEWVPVVSPFPYSGFGPFDFEADEKKDSVLK